MAREPQLRAARECSRCGAMHSRKHAWCTDCARRQAEEGSTFRRLSDYRPAKAPPPPPGFALSDLLTGKPLG